MMTTSNQSANNQAIFHTSMGDITIELFPNHAPKTVANFVELATGAKEWVDPNISEKVKTNLYDGTIFHRVIPGFMIQGGDPLGSGMGGPGYNFADEFHGELNFSIHSQHHLEYHLLFFLLSPLVYKIHRKYQVLRYWFHL